MVKEDGVIDMPLRLMIIAVILILTVPVVLGVVNYYTRVATEQQLISEIHYLENQMKIVFAQGENASLVVRVTFPYGTQYVIIGGELGTVSARIIKYKMENMVERQDVVKYGNLDICFSGTDGKAVMVKGGTYDFIITKVHSPIDLNGDKLANDYYLEIGVRE